MWLYAPDVEKSKHGVVYLPKSMQLSIADFLSDIRFLASDSTRLANKLLNFSVTSRRANIATHNSAFFNFQNLNLTTFFKTMSNFDNSEKMDSKENTYMKIVGIANDVVNLSFSFYIHFFKIEMPHHFFFN